MNKKITLIICSLASLLMFSVPAYAQNILSSGTAIGLHINGPVANGDIVTTSSNEYTLSTSPYDPQIFGVVSIHPAVYLKNTTAPDDTPVISSGVVLVRVSSQNGNIKAGDYITSSTMPGVGVKAVDNGYVLGLAEQNYTSSDPKTTGLIYVTLQPHYAQVNNDIVRNAFSTFNLGINAAMSTPLGVIASPLG